MSQAPVPSVVSSEVYATALSNVSRNLANTDLDEYHEGIMRALERTPHVVEALSRFFGGWEPVSEGARALAFTGDGLALEKLPVGNQDPQGDVVIVRRGPNSTGLYVYGFLIAYTCQLFWDIRAQRERVLRRIAHNMQELMGPIGHPFPYYVMHH